MTSKPCVVVMGVSGCGKSTLGRALAAELGLPFVEGDERHPPRNVAKMAAGTPLTDEDRHDWLATLAGVLAGAVASGHGVVVSCSALRRRYRDQLRAGAPSVRFVHLHGAPAVLAERVNARSGHYMPPSLLQSQLETLEPPAADEAPILLDITLPPDALVAEAVRRLETAAA